MRASVCKYEAGVALSENGKTLVRLYLEEGVNFNMNKPASNPFIANKYSAVLELKLHNYKDISFHQ